MKSYNSTKLEIAMIQWGARLHYATPVALSKMDILKILYTDWNTRSVLGKSVSVVSNALGKPHVFERASGRVIPMEVPSDRINSFAIYNMQQVIWNILNKKTKTSARAVDHYSVGSHALAKNLIRSEFDGANSLYIHACSATRALVEANKKGIFTIVEAISMPYNKLIEHEELLRHRIKPINDESELKDNINYLKEELAYANVVLAASKHVADGLCTLGIDRKKIEIVPYGIEIGSKKYNEEKTKAGRVLFVGNVTYLKGIPYLAQAHRILDRKGLNVDTRVVGPYNQEIIQRREYVGPNYLGQVPRTLVRNEFSAADIFVFPTLSDGFGMVLLEALRAGLPIICTKHCAEVVEDGVNGFVVSARNGLEIAQKIEILVNDRVLRNKMSKNAQKIANRFSLDAYANTLEKVLRNRYKKFSEESESL